MSLWIDGRHVHGISSAPSPANLVAGLGRFQENRERAFWHFRFEKPHAGVVCRHARKREMRAKDKHIRFARLEQADVMAAVRSLRAIELMAERRQIAMDLFTRRMRRTRMERGA